MYRLNCQLLWISSSSLRLNRPNRLSRSLCTTSVTSNADEHPAVPSHCKVVICGGGIVGSSVAYHLAERGWTDVIIIEQGRLTCGTTWHSAGLIGRVRTSPTEMKILDYSRKLYEKLQNEGHDVGWKQTGSIALARSKDRLVEFKRKHSVAKTVGVETHLISPAEVKQQCPSIFTDDLVGAMWIPHDGVVDGKNVSLTMAKLANQKGVSIFEGVTVVKVKTKKGSVREVETTAGTIICDYFVNCAGQWARALGKKTEPKTVKAPLHSCEHYYMKTKPQVGIDSMMPVIRDYDGHVYFREFNKGILAGGFDFTAKPCFHKGIPDNFVFQGLTADWDHFQLLLNNIIHRMPMLSQAEVDQLFNGPESFTPDSRWILGKSPKIKLNDKDIRHLFEVVGYVESLKRTADVMAIYCLKNMQQRKLYKNFYYRRVIKY